MSFKIIQEFRKPGFIIIPEGLESNGVFWYPPLSWSTKKRHNLLKNKFYLPDKAVWEARPCVVKRSRIATYELAEEQEELLLQSSSKDSKPNQDIIVLRSDESSDEECIESKSIQSTSEVSVPQSNKSVVSQLSQCTNSTVAADVKLPLVNINDELWNCFQKTTTATNFRCRVQAMRNSASSPKTTLLTTETPAINCETSSHRILNESLNKIDKDIPLDYDSECDSIACHSNEKSNGQSLRVLSRILKNQQHQQNEISKQLKELKSYIQDGLATIFMELETLTQIQYSNSLSSINPDIYPKKFCIENFKKVSTCEEANRLEKMLMISEFKADMVEKMSKIIGSNGTRVGEGWDCCYDLIETVFQRKFLKICSWTGASTSQMEDAKIAFLKYKNIISFFASVILNADPEFTFDRTKEFFKEVLRTSSEFLRQPSTREENREHSPIKLIEDDAAQHQSWKILKRKRNADVQIASNKKDKLSKNSAFETRIDQILAAANKVLNNARELNMNDNDDDDDDDEDEDDNEDNNENENRNENEDESGPLIENE